jgi:hypothetical protein
MEKIRVRQNRKKDIKSKHKLEWNDEATKKRQSDDVGGREKKDDDKFQKAKKEDLSHTRFCFISFFFLTNNKKK